DWMTTVRGTVSYHTGVEQRVPAQDEIGTDVDLLDLLQLRLFIKTPSGPEEALAEVIFCGIWASTFCTLGPGDRLLIEGAEESDGAFLLLPRRPSAVSVFRRGCHARIDNEKLEVSDLPAWLRMPNTRQ
ncbi:unnamed protein product, partial [Polarella glacialis]